MILYDAVRQDKLIIVRVKYIHGLHDVMYRDILQVLLCINRGRMKQSFNVDRDLHNISTIPM